MCISCLPSMGKCSESSRSARTVSYTSALLTNVLARMVLLELLIYTENDICSLLVAKYVKFYECVLKHASCIWHTCVAYAAWPVYSVWSLCKSGYIWTSAPAPWFRLRLAVLVITVYTNLQLVSTSRMRSVMLIYILPESKPKTAGMHISMC